MSFEIIDNTFQVIVLAAMALLAFILAFRRSSRSCLILAFGYASFMMGTLYYLLHLIIPVSYTHLTLPTILLV